MLNFRIFLVSTVLLLITSEALALEPGDADPLFQNDEVIEVSITAPMATLLGERPNDLYLRGTLSYEEKDGSVDDFDIGIRTRGNFRRQVSVCPFPPLRINFKKSEVKDTLFQNQDKLKLVAHCRDNSDRYEQNILKEYIAYRILNTLTDISYRVRLARITYIDSAQEYAPQTRFAFFIEHKKRLSKRLNLPLISTGRITASDLEGEYSDLTSLFQYLIGNTDFSPIAGPEGEDCCHNSTLFGNEGGPIYSIPYDFDMSGLVNAPYAEPNPRFRIKSVTQRLYRGRCDYMNHLPASLQLVQDNRAAIYSLIEERAELQPWTRKSMSRFINHFYEVIGNPRSLNREIESKCI
jgi:hypothetical protein